MQINFYKRVLAIDYGTKRVGIAISDPLCLFPSITTTFFNDKNLFSQLINIITEKNVEKIIIGFPDSDSGNNSDLAKDIKKFKFELESRTKVSIEYCDEHLTSKMAESRIVETVPKKSKRRDKSLIDAHSAAIMLEDYLKTLEKK